VTELDEGLKDGERLTRSGSALVYLNAGIAPLDVVVRGGLSHVAKYDAKKRLPEESVSWREDESYSVISTL